MLILLFSVESNSSNSLLLLLFGLLFMVMNNVGAAAASAAAATGSIDSDKTHANVPRPLLSRSLPIPSDGIPSDGGIIYAPPDETNCYTDDDMHYTLDGFYTPNNLILSSGQNTPTENDAYVIDVEWNDDETEISDIKVTSNLDDDTDDGDDHIGKKHNSKYGMGIECSHKHVSQALYANGVKETMPTCDQVEYDSNQYVVGKPCQFTKLVCVLTSDTEANQIWWAQCQCNIDDDKWIMGKTTQFTIEKQPSPPRAQPEHDDIDRHVDFDKLKIDHDIRHTKKSSSDYDDHDETDDNPFTTQARAGYFSDLGKKIKANWQALKEIRAVLFSKDEEQRKFSRAQLKRLLINKIPIKRLRRWVKKIVHRNDCKKTKQSIKRKNKNKADWLARNQRHRP